MKILKQDVLLSFFLYSIILGIFLFEEIGKFGSFNYLLDDAYIHLAFAKNLASLGIPSADSYSLSNPSSSPLWSMLLATFYKCNIIKSYFEYVPLFLNIVFSLLAIYQFNILSKNIFKKINILFLNITNVFFVLSVPLVTLTLMGMEHVLQLFLALYLLNIVLKENKNILKLTIVSSLLVLVRYEMSLFLIFTFAFYILLIDRKKETLIKYTKVLIMASIPIIIYGLIMKFHYNLSFFPDSVISKLNGHSTIMDMLFNFNKEENKNEFSMLFFYTFTYFSLLLISILTIFIEKNKKIIFISLIGLVMTLFQLFFSSLVPIRYEAYLIPILIILVFNFLLFKKSIVIKMLAISYIILIIIIKIVFLMFVTYYGIGNIHDQQIKNANFIERNKIKSVALNDLGAVSYFTNSKIIDLEGLGTHKIAILKEKNKLNGKALKNVIIKNNVEWIIIYDKWYLNEDIIPNKCVKIGFSKLKNNYICGDARVDYYYCANHIKKAQKMFKVLMKNNTDKGVKFYVR